LTSQGKKEKPTDNSRDARSNYNRHREAEAAGKRLANKQIERQIGKHTDRQTDI